MNFKDLTDNLLKSGKDDDCKHLLNFEIPDISLPNQNGNLLNLHRKSLFRQAGVSGNYNTAVRKT